MRLLFTLFISVFTFIATAQIPTSGNILWLNADAGVYSDAAGTIPSNNSGYVFKWKDQSGQGHDADAYLATPSYFTNFLNGKPVVYFGGSVAMKTNNINMTVTDKADIFIVFNNDNTATSNSFAFDTRVNLTAPDLGTSIQTANFIRGGLRGNNEYSYTTTNSANQNAQCFRMVENRCDMALTSYESQLFVDGVFINKLTGDKDANNTGNFGNTFATIGYALNAYRLTGNIAEIIMYDRVLTAAERTIVENYLHAKYFSGTATTQFTGIATNAVASSSSTIIDPIWKHTFNTTQQALLISSVKDNCLNLGTLNSTVYNDATAEITGGKYTMRRHFTINSTINISGTKRVRLYYTDADLTNLQAVVLTLTNANQLVVTRYTGANEDGVYGNNTGGGYSFISAAQITTGTAYGANYIEFDVLGTTSFGEFWIHTGTTILPLKFLSFSAQKCNDKTICINWQTENEINV